MGLHFLLFWSFGPSFPFILAFWAFISCHFLLAGAATWGPPHKLPKTVRFLIKFKQILSAAKPAAFCNFWPFGLHFLSFWPFGPSFPFILAFWAFISFHFALLGLHFLSFWPFGPSFPFILGFWAFISFHFGLLGLHFLSFWPSRRPFSFILAFWAFISFHYGLLGLHFSHFGRLNLLKRPSGQHLAQNCHFPFKFCNFSFSKICLLKLHFFFLVHWAFISFHFGLLGIDFLSFLSFWPFGGKLWGKRPVFP